MCGIFGYSGPTRPSDSDIAAALSSLEHRGPDGSGVEKFHIQSSDAVFAHARLAILDLTSAGAQPMRRGKWIVTYNGEIYNARELKSELCSAGAVFDSECDTEVLLHALNHWGLSETLRRLNGMFAFGAADGEELYLVRDRLGIKPLYYWIDGDSIAFASELRALSELPSFRKKIDKRALDHYLTFGYVPAPLCIYQGCGKLRPGTMLRWKKGECSIEEYWTLNASFAGKRSLDVSESLEELDSLLRDSVSARLQSDVPLGAFLSGGIDSSLICAIAQERMSDRLNTFTIGFEFSEFDESKQAEEIARHLGTDHSSVQMDAKEMLEIAPRVPDIYGEPFADPSALPTILLSRITKRSVTVSLSGDGGDEQFYGYSRYLNNEKLALIDLIPKPLRLLAGTALSKLNVWRTKTAQYIKALPYNSFDEALLLRSGIFHRVFFQDLMNEEFQITESNYHERYERLRKAGVSRRQLAPMLDLEVYLPEDILTKVDRASMAHSLEVRVPLLDHRVVEFTNSLPFSMKYCKGEQKRLLKLLLSKYVPRTLWDRPKAGFSVPLNHWFKNELKELLNDHLSKSELSRHGVFNASFVEKMINDHMTGVKDNQYYLWTLLVLQIWLKRTGAAL